MENIYISNWAKGEETINPLTLSLIDSCVRVLKLHNSNLTIKLLCDTRTSQQVSQYVLDNTDMNIVLDQFNNHEPHEWPLVKLKAIGLITDEEVLHLDYDIVCKTPISDLFEAFRLSPFDVIYQKPEELQHPYYSEFLRERKDEYPNIFKISRVKRAYNAGFSYFRSKSSREAYIGTYDFQSEKFGDYIALEQMVVPDLMVVSGFKVGTLLDLIHQLPLQETFEYIAEDHDNIFSKSDWDYMSRYGVFIPNLGIYHFLGDLKQRNGIIELFNSIGGIS